MKQNQTKGKSGVEWNENSTNRSSSPKTKSKDETKLNQNKRSLNPNESKWNNQEQIGFDAILVIGPTHI